MKQPHPNTFSRRLTIDYMQDPNDTRRLMIDAAENGATSPEEQSDAARIEFVQQLRALMRNTPVQEIDRLTEIRQKVRDGDYLNRSVAEDSARCMLDGDGTL